MSWDRVFSLLILQLVIVWATGIGVLVRCFSEKTRFEKEIIHRLGSSFSRVAYIIVVVCVVFFTKLFPSYTPTITLWTVKMRCSIHKDTDILD